MLSTQIAAGGPSRYTKRVLMTLGIQAPPHSGGFWNVDKDQLEYLYEDFRRLSRERKKHLHPDKDGGNLAEFARFSADCDMVTRQFQRRGIGPQPSPAERLATFKHMKERAYARYKARKRENYRRRRNQ